MSRTTQATANDKIIVTAFTANVVGLVWKGKARVLGSLCIQAGLGNRLGAAAQQQQKDQ